MKKLINDPYKFVENTLSGIMKAYPFHLRSVEGNPRALVRSDAPIKGKVSIVTGGGSGHIPVFIGYVGQGLLDGVAVGNVFSSPSSDDILTAARECHGGAGVLFLFGNYQGDKMNFEMASEAAEFENIKTSFSIVSDDIASASPEEWEKRRGVAGLFFAYKVAGAKADTMVSLDEVKATVDDAIANIRSLGIALTPCTVPAAGKPSFEISDDEMELGMGIHGERGIERTKLKSADDITDEIMRRLIVDKPFNSGDEVAMLVNGLGATPPEELFILYNRAHDILKENGISVYRSYVGEYATSMEMAGASVTLMKLNDERKVLLDAPAFSPFLPQWRKK